MAESWLVVEPEVNKALYQVLYRPEHLLQCFVTCGGADEIVGLRLHPDNF